MCLRVNFPERNVFMSAGTEKVKRLKGILVQPVCVVNSVGGSVSPDRGEVSSQGDDLSGDSPEGASLVKRGSN